MSIDEVSVRTRKELALTAMNLRDGRAGYASKRSSLHRSNRTLDPSRGALVLTPYHDRCQPHNTHDYKVGSYRQTDILVP